MHTGSGATASGNTADAETVLGAAAELALATGTRMVEPAAIERAAADRHIAHERLFAGLVELRGHGLVQLAAAEPSQIVLVAMTDAGLRRHLEATRPDLAEVEARLATAATGAAGQGPVPLADELGEPPLLVELLLDAMVNQRRLVYSKAPGRRFRIHRVTASAPPRRGSR